jgi:hypothetical protein
MGYDGCAAMVPIAGSRTRSNAMSSPEVQRWAVMAMNHWREFCPKRYARLRRSKNLFREAVAAAELTATAMNDLIESGATSDEAWQQVRELYLLVPEESGGLRDTLPRNVAYQAMAEFVRDLQEDEQ